VPQPAAAVPPELTRPGRGNFSTAGLSLPGNHPQPREPASTRPDPRRSRLPARPAPANIQERAQAARKIATRTQVSSSLGVQIGHSVHSASFPRSSASLLPAVLCDRCGALPGSRHRREEYLAEVSVVFVHGMPETSEVWRPLFAVMDRDAIAVALPGLGAARPDGFTGTKDAYARWLGEMLDRVEKPVDVVGHDLGALLTMRIASAFDISLRSWAVDVANIFHPQFIWPERMRNLQVPGVGEEMLKTEREADPDDPRSTASHLIGSGVPRDLAKTIAAAHDEVMSRSILDFYRSAIPNVGAGWWEEITGPTCSQGLVLLLPDPPEDEAMSVAVARRLGAKTARLNDLNHCWMAEAPEVVAAVLERFWSSLD